MAKHPLWSDEYWLLLMQLYLKKPAGLKPLYSRGLVNLALELHIPPQFLYEQMFRLRQLESPRLEQLWEKYSNSPKKLSRGVKLLRQMNGFGQANDFYEGVEVNESWERDFRPLEADDQLMPLHLIVVLDLYFRLTPITMVAETPEIIELGRMMKLPAPRIVEIMETYQVCDPYLKRQADQSPLLGPCQEVWNRYGNDNPEKLAALAAQMKVFFSS